MRSTNRHLRWAATAALVAMAAGGVLAQQTTPAGRQGGRGRQGGPPPGSFQRVAPLPFPDQPQVVETTAAPLRVTPMFKGLESPWSLAFLPTGDMLITEKPGRLRIVRGGTRLERAAADHKLLALARS